MYDVLPEGEKLVFLKITDPFFLYVKVAVLAAVFLTSPYLLFQIWRGQKNCGESGHLHVQDEGTSDREEYELLALRQHVVHRPGWLPPLHRPRGGAIP